VRGGGEELSAKNSKQQSPAAGARAPSRDRDERNFNLKAE
jgi:hypothetical protein